MKCPNCIVGDLLFSIRGSLKFQSDERGKPYGTALVERTDGDFWMECDTCHAHFSVHGWHDDTGQVILNGVDPQPEGQDTVIGIEPKSPPPAPDHH